MKSKRRNEDFELEAKYSITEQEYDTLPSLVDNISRKRKLFVAGVRNVVLEDHYFDTPDFAFARNHTSFRIRTRVGPVPKVSFKAPILLNPRQKSLYRRIEIEGTLSGELLDEISRHNPRIRTQGFSIRAQPDYTDQKEALERIDLHEKIKLVNHRRVYTILYSDELTAELCLDQVTCSTNESSTSFHEMECEFLSGDSNLMPELCRFLEKHIHWLQPSEINKYERALFELKVIDIRDKARDKALSVWQKAITNAFKTIQALHEKACTFEDPEIIHDYRVAIRQLLSALKVLLSTPDYSGQSGHSVYASLKKLQKGFGAVRDTDVLIENHIALKVKVGELPLLDGILKVLLRRKSLVQYKALRIADDYWTDDLKQAWDEFIYTDLPLVTYNAAYAKDYFLALEGQYIQLRDGLHQTLAAQDLTTSEKFKQLHKMRLLSKNLRYLSEMLKGLLPKSISKGKSLYKTDQATLGAINDAYNQIMFYHEIERELPGLRDTIDLAVAGAILIGRINELISQISPGHDGFGSIEPARPISQLESIHGIGPGISRKLKAMGFNTKNDLASLDRATWDLIMATDDAIKSMSERYGWWEQLHDKGAT